jgi:NAD(P)-dependent dehydrogenase (short-subunit alcohol dehydrogenase family)
MDIAGKIVAVTGGANGIGKALAERFHREGAKGIAILDIEIGAAQHVAEAIGGVALETDLRSETQIDASIDVVERTLGPIDLFCSNAGIIHPDAPEGSAASCPNEKWRLSWAVNVMAHVYAARALVPRMVARGGGTFLITASAAGLLSQIGSAPYSVTKHAAVGFAESLAITHGDDGIKVSVLCPQAVQTRMLGTSKNGGVAGVDGVMAPEDLAEAVVRGLGEESFLILPHPEVRQYMLNKANNYDRWIGGMRKLRRRFRPAA